MTESAELLRWTTLKEGQFFERKSAVDRSGGSRRLRRAPEVAKDIAETLSAMANADGGELLVGIEDDGECTGVSYPEDRLELLLRAPGERNYIVPPLKVDVERLTTPDGKLLLHYSVGWSASVHQLSDGRYVLRVNDANMPFPADQIAALKATKAQGLVERSFPAGAGIHDMDLALVSLLADKMNETGLPKDVLKRFGLIEERGGELVPCLSGLLLFGHDPSRWHPRCSIDVIRWDGPRRLHGTDLNILRRTRIEGPLSTIVERAYAAIKPYIGERQRLHDLFFTESLEYPTFVWQEALVNAVAHRDYGIAGAPIELWMFDDRIEVRSPGLPPQPVTVEALNQQEHLHISRNPLLVRVLVALGYMREIGEGIPRMFSEMEREGFYPPHFSGVGGALFQVVLRNQPVYDAETMQWLHHFDNSRLSGDQKRLLVHAHAKGNRFTSREYQSLAGLDVYRASNSIKDLIRKRVIRSTGLRSRIYEILEPEAARREFPPEYLRLLSALQRNRLIGNEDIRREMHISRAAATRLARDLHRMGLLERQGTGRWTLYRLADTSMHHSPNASDSRECDA